MCLFDEEEQNTFHLGERVRGRGADCSRQYEVIDFLAVQIALRASSANTDFQLSTGDCGPLRSEALRLVRP